MTNTQATITISSKDFTDTQIKTNAIQKLAALPLSGTTLDKIAELMANPGAEESFMKALNNPMIKGLFK